jgi:hypothetical protein
MTEQDIQQVASAQVSEEVELSAASDTDIEAFLSSLKVPEVQKAPETQEEAKDDKTRDTVPQAEIDNSPAATTEQLAAKNAQLREALRKQTQFAQMRSTEIGELRKQLRQINMELKGGISEKIIEDPESAIDAKLQIKANEEKLRELDNEESSVRARHDAMHIVTTHLPPEQFDIDGMAGALVRDGFTPDDVRPFIVDPFGFADAPTLIHLAKRVNAEKALVEVANYAKKLEVEITKLRNKPDSILQNIQNATSSKQMTAASGGGSSMASNVNLNPSVMSDLELDSYIKQYRN